MHVRDHVLTVHGQLRVARQPQRGVQHRTILGGVDVITAEHRRDLALQVLLPRETAQQVERLVRDEVLAVIDVEIRRLPGQPLPATGVAGEEVAQMRLADLLRMRLQRLPLRRARDRFTHELDLPV